jgi:hypothetical protein
MNVLILTPDAVGSTLLQRMLTIYMQFHEFNRPVINLHELTNGLAKYYSPEFNQEIVSKKAVEDWGYFQTLQQVVELLSSVDHYKTSRLAHYHIRRRGDTVEQQIPFYNYLNENFYIIACRRANVFEHAASMSLSQITKKLNVYDPYEKISTFFDIFKSGIQLDPGVFVKQLNDYKLYLDWSDQYFNIASYFNYEQDVPELENFILNLPIFSGQQQRVTWQTNFGMSFNTWNKVHYTRSNIRNLIAESCSEVEKLVLDCKDYTNDYQQYAYPEWPAITSGTDINNLPVDIKQQLTQDIIRRDGVESLLTQEQQQRLAPLKHGYTQAQHTINQMVELGIIINGPPIKKQTLLEKSQSIKNFQQLVEIYNNWLESNPGIGLPMTPDSVASSTKLESAFWDELTTPNKVLPGLLPNQQ